MTTTTLRPSTQPLHDCLDQWRAEQASVEADLAESFAALEGFQKSLDAWRYRLVTQEESLASQAQQLADEQSAWTNEQGDRTELVAQIEASQQELNNQKAEFNAISAQLTEANGYVDTLVQEASVAKDKIAQLEADLEKQREESREQQSRWDEDFKRMRQMLDRRSEAREPATEAPAVAEEASTAAEDPVLDSVMAQFGKLRLQKAGRQERS